MDWLRHYGHSAGFQRDDQLPDYDLRLDFRQFVLRQGRNFEEAVLTVLAGRLPVTVVGGAVEDSRSLQKAMATFEAMLDGTPIISQAVLRNPDDQMYGVADLLIRSDVLNDIYPDAFAGESEGSYKQPAVALAGKPWHYRVVDIKFTTLHLRESGEASHEHLAYMAQSWVYNEALGRLQEFTPPSSYLLGRGWERRPDRGNSSMERLARVEHASRIQRFGLDLRDVVHQAATWIRMVRKEGKSWKLLPEPSRVELYPNMKESEDAPWHAAKQQIAESLADLTMLWNVGPSRRRVAHASGVKRWDDPACSAARLGIQGAKQRQVLDAILTVNRSSDTDAVRPRHITAVGTWRQTRSIEFFVDFETVTDLADDFEAMPERGGRSLIFMIGCCTLEQGKNWRFDQFVARDLTEEAECEIIDAWIGHLRRLADEAHIALSEARLFHWSPAETSSLETAYNSAEARHPERRWPRLNWYDLLMRLARHEPVAVRGAFGFGLKAVANALYSQGRIKTKWQDSRLDGLGAMVGAWWCAEEARNRGMSLLEVDLMGAIGHYNEVDCRVMMEILEYLRKNH